MKVAINTDPIKSGHSTRGIGSYTRNLVDQLKESRGDIKFIFFENPTTPPPADIIHYPYFDLFFHTLPLRKKAKRVVTVHDVIPLIFPAYFPSGIRGYINFFFQKRALKKADAIICDSKTSKNDIYERLSIEKNKIHVVYLAPASIFRPVENKNKMEIIIKKYKLPNKFVLYVGDVNWNKNILNILEATQISKIPVVFAGKAFKQDIPETKRINNKIKKLKIYKYVFKTGYIPEEDLVYLYNAASLTIMPSYYEGFGLPVLESMACGTPVICSDVASLSEIARGPAIFCNPEDPLDIAAKIKKVFNLPQSQRRLICQKSIMHASKFSWEKTASQTINVYKSLK